MIINMLKEKNMIKFLLISLFLSTSLLLNECSGDKMNPEAAAGEEKEDVLMREGYLSYGETSDSWSIICHIPGTIDRVDVYRILNPQKDYPKEWLKVKFSGVTQSSGTTNPDPVPAGTVIHYIKLTKLVYVDE
jgi:hypothetical protein